MYRLVTSNHANGILCAGSNLINPEMFACVIEQMKQNQAVGIVLVGFISLCMNHSIAGGYCNKGPVCIQNCHGEIITWAHILHYWHLWGEQTAYVIVLYSWDAILVKSARSPAQTLWASDAIWWIRTGSTLAQVMACCLAAPFVIFKWRQLQGRSSKYLSLIWKLVCLQVHLPGDYEPNDIFVYDKWWPSRRSVHMQHQH